MSSGISEHEIDIEGRLIDRVREEVSNRLSDDLNDEEVEELILETAIRLLPGIPYEDVEKRAKTIGDEFIRYGPLQPLIDDPEVSEILVGGGGRDPKTGEFKRPRVFAEVAGINHPCPTITFDSEEHLIKTVARIGRRANRRCDEASPLMDAQLPDGSRVNAVHHSVAIDGQTLNIRKFKRDVMTPAELVAKGSCTQDMMDFLKSCVLARVSMVVSGGTASGKTTMLNALSSYIPRDEHIVIIEDTAELQLHHPHIDRLQARPKNAEGEGEITLHALVVNALRMKPDRIVVGECRSSEAIEMLQAMQTGHDGSLTTVHANSAMVALGRIRSMARENTGLDRESVDEQIAESIDLVIQTKKLHTGQRVIKEIMTVDKYSDGVISHSTLFSCEEDPFSDKIEFRPAGQQPHAIKQKMHDAGIRYVAEWFFEDGRY